MKTRTKLALLAAPLLALALGAALAQVPILLRGTLIGTEFIELVVPSAGTVVTNPQTQSTTINTLAAFVQAGSGAAGTNGQVYLGVTGSAPKFSTMSQDCTITNAGVITCLKTNNVAFTTASTTALGTSGATIPLNNSNNTVSGLNTFTGTLNQLGSASGTPSHVSSAQTTAPALTSCGTGSPAITGTDTAGIVTLGTNATGCVITFNVAYTGTPYCVVSWIATPLASQSYVTSNAAITLTQTSTSGNKAQYICLGTAGG